MKRLSFFIALGAWWAAWYPAPLYTQTITFSTKNLYTSETQTESAQFTQINTVQAQSPLFKFFAGVETADSFFSNESASVAARGESAGRVNVLPQITLLAGNLTKPSALTRLENPVPVSFSSAASGASVSAIGVKSDVFSSVGNHREAFALQCALPKTKVINHGSFAEWYTNADGTQGARVTLLFGTNKTTVQTTTGWYTYRLAPKEETSWFLSTPYFAPDIFSAFLAEVSVRSRVFRGTLPLVFYASLGFPESPFGGFLPWTRAEIGIPLPIASAVVTIKGRFFYAEKDFYTPKNSLVAARTKTAAGIVLTFPAMRVVAVSTGVSFSYDEYTQMSSSRAAVTLAAFGASLDVHGFFSNWKIAPKKNGIIAASDTAIGANVTAAYIFSLVKPALTVSYTWYPGKLWQGTKETFSAALSAAPRTTKTTAHSLQTYIPTASCRFDATLYADTRFTGTMSAGASWRITKKHIIVLARIETMFTLAPR